jgi:hypothetical protein
VLRRQCDQLARTRKDERNHKLNCAAYAIGRVLESGGLSREQVEQRLTEAAAAAGMHPIRDKIAPTLRSGLEAGLRLPRCAPARTPGGAR